MKNDKTEQLFIGKQGDGISEDEKGTEVKVAILACKYAPTALIRYGSTSLSYNHVASVMRGVKNYKPELLFIGKQVGGIGEVEKGTEEWVAILAC